MDQIIRAVKHCLLDLAMSEELIKRNDYEIYKKIRKLYRDSETSLIDTIDNIDDWTYVYTDCEKTTPEFIDSLTGMKEQIKIHLNNYEEFLRIAGKHSVDTSFDSNFDVVCKDIDSLIKLVDMVIEKEK